MDIDWTPDGDILFSDGGNLEMVSGSEEVKARVQQRILTWQGEWDYDILEGMPWLQILRGDADETRLHGLVRGELSRLFGSEKIGKVTVEVDKDLRKLNFTAIVDGDQIETEIG